MPSPLDPVVFTLGPLTVRWYAIFILAGILLGMQVVGWVAARRGLDPEFATGAAPLVIAGAIVGARLYYVALQWRYFVDHPDEIIGLQLRGLTIHGALAGGILTFWWLCRRQGEPFLRWADTIAAGIPVGQALGRLGNWANQEAFGRPSDLPWAVEISPERRPAAYASAETFHPTVLYESIGSVVIAAVVVFVLLRLGKRPWFRDGMGIGLYLVLYGLVRLPIESLRTDSLRIGPYPAAYWLSAALIVAGVAIIWVVRARPRST